MNLLSRTFATLIATTTVAAISVPALALRVPPAPEYDGRNDPNNEGGDRHGEDPDWTGYPVDSGKPGDRYYDPTTEYRPYSPNWTGASTGFGIQGGFSRPYGQAFDSNRNNGYQIGGFVQTSTVLNIVDLIGSVTYASANVTVNGAEADLNRWELSASATLHPGLFFLLGGSTLDRIISSIYLMGGGHLTHQRTIGTGIDSKFFRPGWHLGTGLDFNLDSVNNGKAAWIGIQYRWNNTAGGLKDDHYRYVWTRDHQVLLRLMFRWNGNVARGIPGPSRP